MPKTNQDPFPFIGAGKANYYEWCNLLVRFVNAPTKDKKKEIIKLAPKPIKPVQSDFSGKILNAGSGQFVNMYIEEVYGSNKKKVIKKEVEFNEDEENFNEDDFDLPIEFDVSPKAHAAFEAHIESWLHDINAICPIEIVYRHEDMEAGGTKLSSWHKKSALAIPDLLNKWSTNEDTFKQKKKEGELFQFLLAGVLEYGKIKEKDIPERILSAFFPEKVIRELFKKGDLDKITSFITEHKKNSSVIDVCVEQIQKLLKTKNYDKIYKFSELWLTVLATTDLFSEIIGVNYEVIGGVCHAAIIKNDNQLKIKIIKKLSHRSIVSNGTYTDSCDFANNLGAYAYKLHGLDHWPHIIELYKMALDIKTNQTCSENLQLYCNALWVLQNDNTGLPVNRMLNEYFLTKCLPHGAANPAIFFNAACLWVEMNDFDKALENVKLAHKYEYDMYEYMIQQITKTDKMFSDFRKFKPFVAWLNSTK